jgi:hypothetical protein
MSKQYPGGLITKTPVVPTSFSAPGIWSLSDQAYWQSLNSWPFPRDPQFNYVTMLLHGDGTNGAQNNTFLDSSTNNFTITRNGNTTQGTFTPYGSNWSANFASSSTDYLSAASNAAFAFGTGDFTMEAFVFATASQTDNWIIGLANNCWFRVGSGGALEFYNAVTSTSTLASSAMPINTWNHVAVVRSGTALTIYQNGVSVGTATVSTNFSSSVACTIGNQVGYDRRFNGYISNARIVKGTAVYTAAFTPSTTPLTAITNTSLLTCQSNRFIDNSSNAFTLTVSGSPSVQRFSPFSPTTAYSTSVIGGSAYFDGTADNLQTPSNSAFNFSATDCTLEFWYYGAGSSGLVFEFGSSTPDTAAMQCEFSSGTLTFKPIGASSSFFAIQKDAWNYIAAVKTGTTYYLYINGTRNTSSTGTAASSSQIINIGARNGGSVAPITGYLSDFRVSNTARYTAATMTVPTTPSTAIANTQLMLNYTNAGILDNAMMNDLETVGNAQISTSVKKYGTGSMYFDGSGDGLIRPVSPLFDFGSGSFTVEFWANCVSTSGFGFFVSCWEDSGGSDANSSWLIRLNSGTVITHFMQGTGTFNTLTSTSISTNTWFHFAWVKNGTTQTMYIDGTSVASGTVTGSMNTAVRSLRVGYQGASTNFLNGYIDDLRITKGVARYTANFTVPDQAFQLG